MAIKVEKEPNAYSDNLPMEHCAFCWELTTYWHIKNDVAVCPECAGKYVQGDVPTKKDWWKQTRGINDNSGK